MRNIILFDDDSRDDLLPLTFTRPVGMLRLGILTIAEKWEKRLEGQVSYITQDYLSDKFPIQIEDDNFVINGGVCPSEQLVHLILQLEDNQALLDQGDLIAARLSQSQFQHLMEEEELEELQGFELADTEYYRVQKPWHLFSLNEKALKDDFEWLTKDRTSVPISSTNQTIAPENIFLEEGAQVECAVLNASAGPIYVGKNAIIMEGAMVRGGLALNEGAQIKMGAKIYGATTVGPYSKVGGEVANSVFQGFANKGHDGYLGNSVIGEWCNLGADSNISNLKNNYTEVRLWNYPQERFVSTGLTFCGLVMGDHSKCGINTMFNTGTVVGVFANIFGSGYPRNFIPSFSWGGASGFTTYKLSKACEVAEIVMARRKKELTDLDVGLLRNVFNDTAKFRHWEKVSQP
ncbi:MAG: glucose-1-phosphate thymidylyltransferase [Saprospiraceae bacterium]|nr:glucose-1-phosphate thymidylyltransferase [Saprospiraceae bacterium]